MEHIHIRWLKYVVTGTPSEGDWFGVRGVAFTGEDTVFILSVTLSGEGRFGDTSW